MTAPSTPVKQNKGEWSEFYAFLRLLGTGHLAVLPVDPSTPPKTCPVEAVERNGLLFRVVGDKVVSWKKTSGTAKPHMTSVAGVTPARIESVSSALLVKLRSKGTGSTFDHPDSDALAKALGVATGSHKGGTKGDLSLCLPAPPGSARGTTYPVSVKSWVGNNPTLINPAPASTRMLFRLGAITAPPPAAKNARALVRLLAARKVSIVEPGQFEDPAFAATLRKLRASDLLAEAVLKHFSRAPKGRTTFVGLAVPPGTFTVFESAMRDLLRAAALGMTPGTEWDGTVSAEHSLLLVGKRGQLFGVLGRPEIEKFLFQHAYFDDPDTKRHKYGYVQVKGDEPNEWELVLNFQVRLSLPNELRVKPRPLATGPTPTGPAPRGRRRRPPSGSSAA